MTPDRPISSAETRVIHPSHDEPEHFAWIDLVRQREKEALPPIKRHPFSGLYVVFEGTGGSGKDTVSRAIQRKLEGYDNGRYEGRPYPEVSPSKLLWTHEPGGTHDAEVLREVVTTTQLPLLTQLELFRMARESSLPLVVQPVLEQGGLVLQVRTALSTFAYQGFGFGAGADMVLDCNRLFLEKFIPDVVVFIERDIEEALAQVVDEGGKRDVYDVDIDLNNKALDGYKKAREVFGVCDWIWVDNSMGIYDVDQTIKIVWDQLAPKIHSWYAKTYGSKK